MPRAIVTGGAGFVGSHLCRELRNRGWEVVAVDNLMTGRRQNVEDLIDTPGFEFVEHDVIESLPVSGSVDAVLHLASPASPPEYLSHPIETLEVGSIGTKHALEVARDHGARFLLASTSEVYGDPLVHPQPETYWGNVNSVGPRAVYDEAKRYAEALTMTYHRHHDLDTKIVRIFNSVLADEQVLFDDGVTLRRETAAELAQRVGIGAELRGLSVPSFDAAGSINTRSASHFVGHPPASKCYEVKLRYGRSIRVTGDHSLFVQGDQGTPEPRSVTDLQVGDRVAIAGRLSVPERDRVTVRMTEVWDALGLDAWDLTIMAPGFGDNWWPRRGELSAAIERCRRPRGEFWRESIASRLSSDRKRDQLALGAMRVVGIPIPSGAWVRLRKSGPVSELPETIDLTNELLWVLGLFVAEGSWHRQERKSSFVTISGDVELLKRAEKILQRDLGLHVTWGRGDAKRSWGIFVHSVPLLHLFDHLGLLTKEKRIPGWVLGLPLGRLKWFLEGYREGDGVHSGKKFEEAALHEFSTTSTDLKDDLIVALARFGLVPSVGRYTTTLKHRTGDRRYPFWRVTLSRVDPWSPLAWDAGVAQHLQARRHGDIVWANVKSIEEVESTPLVYDFCVPGTENFWAGSGVMAHNTYGPALASGDGRVVSNFLSQAMDGKPLTVYGDGTQTRSFCYVEDEVRGLLALLGSDCVGPMNIGNPDEFTVLELAELVLEITGSDSEIAYEELPVDDPVRRRPDISLAQRELGWRPEIDLREGLARTYDWYRRERERGRA